MNIQREDKLLNSKPQEQLDLIQNTLSSDNTGNIEYNYYIGNSSHNIYCQIKYHNNNTQRMPKTQWKKIDMSYYDQSDDEIKQEKDRLRDQAINDTELAKQEWKNENQLIQHYNHKNSAVADYINLDNYILHSDLPKEVINVYKALHNFNGNQSLSFLPKWMDGRGRTIDPNDSTRNHSFDQRNKFWKGSSDINDINNLKGILHLPGYDVKKIKKYISKDQNYNIINNDNGTYIVLNNKLTLNYNDNGQQYVYNLITLQDENRQLYITCQIFPSGEYIDGRPAWSDLRNVNDRFNNCDFQDALNAVSERPTFINKQEAQNGITNQELEPLEVEQDKDYSLDDTLIINGKTYYIVDTAADPKDAMQINGEQCLPQYILLYDCKAEQYYITVQFFNKKTKIFFSLTNPNEPYNYYSKLNIIIPFNEITDQDIKSYLSDIITDFEEELSKELPKK